MTSGSCGSTTAPRSPARSVIIATGVSYRRLDVPELEHLQGRGVFYGAAVAEAPSMGGKSVVVVGGGNSAGQAAIHLADFATQVTMLVRGPELAASMSDYLIRQLDEAPNVEVRLHSAVSGGGGDGYLDHLVIRDLADGSDERIDADGLFLLIGSQPHTDGSTNVGTRRVGLRGHRHRAVVDRAVRHAPSDAPGDERPGRPGGGRRATRARSSGSRRRSVKAPSPSSCCTTTCRRFAIVSDPEVGGPRLLHAVDADPADRGRRSWSSSPASSCSCSLCAPTATSRGRSRRR